MNKKITTCTMKESSISVRRCGRIAREKSDDSKYKRTCGEQRHIAAPPWNPTQSRYAHTSTSQRSSTR